MYIPIKFGKSAFLTLEAAIVLPLFLIAVLTIGSVMRIAYYEERAAFLTANELASIAADAYFMPLYPQFPSNMERIISQKIPELSKVSAEKYRYRFKNEKTDQLIHIEISFRMKTGLPGPMISEYGAVETYLVRAFCGKDNSFYFESEKNGELNSDLEAETVYLMPEFGTKYHEKNCSYVNSYPLQTVLISSMKKKYKACGSCKPKDICEGAVVYYFRYGEAYHEAGCSTIEKYVVNMDRRDAEKRGYLPCSKCGGK